MGNAYLMNHKKRFNNKNHVTSNTISNTAQESQESRAFNEEKIINLSHSDVEHKEV